MRNAHGFTLIEIVVVLAIIGFIVAMGAMATRAIVVSQKRSVTLSRMSGVDSALVQFVIVQKRMPCPADGTQVAGSGSAGVEGAHDATGCTTNQANGVVPWTTLGISEADATDGWDRRLTFRIDPTLAATSAMDMSYCDPAGTGDVYGSPPPRCNPNCASGALASCTTPLKFLNTKGLKVQNVAGTLVSMDPNPAPPNSPTGAAYVLISPGESGGGAFLGSGQISASTVVDGGEEQKNYAALPVSLPPGYYVDDGFMDGPNHFDDILSRPSVLSVINKASLGPRSHP